MSEDTNVAQEAGVTLQDAVKGLSMAKQFIMEQAAALPQVPAVQHNGHLAVSQLDLAFMCLSQLASVVQHVTAEIVEKAQVAANNAAGAFGKPDLKFDPAAAAKHEG